MLPQQPETGHKVQEQQRRQQRKVVIGQHVMHTLGQPGDLRAVQVRNLWDDHYRVNVFVGLDAASAKVAHSYFLVADSDGNILASTPNITRQYE
jgi:hypothetical protein